MNFCFHLTVDNSVNLGKLLCLSERFHDHCQGIK